MTAFADHHFTQASDTFGAQTYETFAGQGLRQSTETSLVCREFHVILK